MYRPWQWLQKRITQMIHDNNWGGIWGVATRREIVGIEEVSGSSLVASCIQWVTTNFLSAPILLEELRADEWQTLPNDIDFIRLLNNPNPYIPAPLFWAAVLTNYYIGGNAYIIKIRDNGGRVRELWPVHYKTMTPKSEEGDFITYYEYQTGTGIEKIKPEDVIHLRTYNRDSNIVGRSYLADILDELDIDQKANEFVSALLENYGVASIIFSPRDRQDWINERKGESMKRRIEEKLKGKNRGGVLVLSAPSEVKTVAFDPGTMDLRFTRDTSEERVASRFGLDITVLGWGAGIRSTQVGATRVEARKQSWEDGIIPLQRIFAEFLFNQLLVDFYPDTSRYRIRFDISVIPELQEDATDKAKRFTSQWLSGEITRAESRGAQGFDISPEDDVYFVPRGGTLITPAGEVVFSPASATPTDEDEDEDDEEEVEEEDDDDDDQ